jgi:lysozyme family protein
MNFDEAFDKLIGFEGGYSNHPSDPGGETMWGVTKVEATAAGYTGAMKNLPKHLAKKIYRNKYWQAVRADELPDLIRYATFDAAVNSGPVQAIKWLQRALGVTDDGVIGAKTLLAASMASADITLRKMLGQRLIFMAGLSGWPAFGRGWARRIAELLH